MKMIATAILVYSVCAELNTPYKLNNRIAVSSVANNNRPRKKLCRENLQGLNTTFTEGCQTK